MMCRSFVFVVSIVVLLGCDQQIKDKGIKQMITAKAKEKLEFAGVDYVVQNGGVTLRGTCATQQEKTKVENEVKQIAGVKSVVSSIVITPVILNGEHLLKRAADSLLMNYPLATAKVQDSIIYLQGELPAKETEKIMSDLRNLGAKAVNYQMQISGK